MASRSISAGLLALLLSAPAVHAQRATIQGLIRFDGPAPERARLAVAHDQSYCGPSVPSRHLLVKERRVQDVVVYLEGVRPMDLGRGRPIEVRHQGCDITSPVQTAEAGAELTLKNADGIRHSVSVQRLGKEVARVALEPMHTRTDGKALDEPGLTVVGCTLHTWIQSYVWVFDHPFYAVSRADGTFEIPFIFPGKYKLTAWHAELGTQTQEVTVGADQVLKVGFVFPAQRFAEQ